jgi:hypothetical protein
VRRLVDIVILSRAILRCAILCCVLGGCVTAASAQTPPSLPPPSPQSSPALTAPAAPSAQAAEEAATGGQPAEPAKPSATATPTTEFHRTPERFGGIPASESTPVARSRPRLSVGKPIGVMTTRVGRDDDSDDSAEGSAPPVNCDVQSDVQILHDKPTGKTREVATLNVDGAPTQHEDILALLKRKACEAGANAVLIKTMAKTRVEGVTVDHVEAVALIVGTPKPPVDPSPVPKSITVTPEGPAVPKTITVDPGASP